MLLFLEIFLTISAYRRGFKAMAFLPLGLALLIGFVIGYNNPEAAVSYDAFDLIWIDVLAIIALGIMNAVGYSVAEPTNQESSESLTFSGNADELPENQ